MDSRHGRTLSAADFQSASLITSDSTPVLPHKERRQVSICDTLPTYVKELIAGGAAGGIAKTIVAPLERVKILYQTRCQSVQCLGVVQSLRFIQKKEGFLGFYRGNGASVIRVVPYAALHFMTYEQYRRAILNHYPWEAPGADVDFLAGSLAGGTAVLCTYPLDLARTRLAYQVKDAALNARVYKGIGDVFCKAYMECGLRGLYRGVGPTLYGMLPYAGLKFYLYEKLKSSLPTSELQNSIVSKLVCGALAGLVGQTIIYPLDVVRRQMQVQTPCAHQGYKSTFDGLVTIFRNQGVKQLYSGISINHIKLVPSVAIGFASYDVLKSLLRVPPRETGHQKAITA
ncbi:hypothetical protein GOP47_0019595 [Adiantum capillus-veneris]|uniref:Uncharacterized protein n=1 Tax=Adiantum capillus-veneris TaxID=13818 RepID=A0A9D4Z8M0_ADICA|nr:hypothetical protein GOP47_0019595 [Adiantum capillus-veneris]